MLLALGGLDRFARLPAFTYTRAMTIDLADPSFEPTDDELIGLSRRAFAGVKAQNAEMLRLLRERIAKEPDEAERKTDR
jgi:hypothetical protein